MGRFRIYDGFMNIWDGINREIFLGKHCKVLLNMKNHVIIDVHWFEFFSQKNGDLPVSLPDMNLTKK